MFEVMVQHSENCLRKFFGSLTVDERENVGLMGGWAVHLLLARIGVTHIGSRDLDIFFNPKKIKMGNLVKMVEDIGFIPHSTFRWAKFIQLSTERELSEEESKTLPAYDVEAIFIDVASPQDVNRRVMHLPILQRVFEGESERCTYQNLEILTPNVKVLIEMKLASASERKEAFKRAKDLADLYALLNHETSSWRLNEGGERVSVVGFNPQLISGFKSKLEQMVREGSVTDAASMLKTGADVLIRLFELM